MRTPTLGLLLPLLMCCVGNAAETETPTIETVLIQGATFTMGTPLKPGDSEYHDDEAPMEVTVETFRIGKYPVTAKQMCAFLNSERTNELDRRTLYNHQDIGEYKYSTITLGDDGKYVPREGAEATPANQVTWKGAVLFCEWYSEQTGKQYRLPSEEWELAARGPERRNWPWGDATPGKNHGERYDREGRLSWSRTPVGSHPKNATKDGICDLLSYTIGEWCANAFEVDNTPEQATDIAANLDDLQSPRVVRGYLSRSYPVGGQLRRLTTYGWRSHLGRPWTRVGIDPMKEVERAARHGFRIVEVVAMPN